MFSRSTPLFTLLALAFMLGALVLYMRTSPAAQEQTAQVISAVATTSTPAATSTAAPHSPAVSASSSTIVSSDSSAPKQPQKKPKTSPISGALAGSTTPTQASNQLTRILNPYPFAPLSSDVINSSARAAIVNILCISSGKVHSTAGSGVIIDPRGVILTNAHVAQYVLLSEDPGMHVACTIRTGSPARSAWVPSVLYLPPAWVADNSGQIQSAEPTGNGAHDYALLLVDSPAQGGQSIPRSFASLPFDTRNGIGFAGDQVLVAAYPAEFLGGQQAVNDLYANTSIATIGSLITFGSENDVDVLSLGGIIEAQSGSSGGAIVNPWGRLIGIISTVSQGDTTGQRDLHAITLRYIDADIAAQTGTNLSGWLAGDLGAEQHDFDTQLLPGLLSAYEARLSQ